MNTEQTSENIFTYIKYQLPHTRFDQISDHKHHIYLYGKLFTNMYWTNLLFLIKNIMWDDFY